ANYPTSIHHHQRFRNETASFPGVTDNPRGWRAIITLNQSGNGALTFQSFRLTPSPKYICLVKPDPILKPRRKHVQSAESHLLDRLIKLHRPALKKQSSNMLLIQLDSIDEAYRVVLGRSPHPSLIERIFTVRGKDH